MKIKKTDAVKVFSDTRSSPSLRNLKWQKLTRDREINSYIVVAPPKSGSTWTTNVLAKSIPAGYARFCYAWSSNEHDLYPAALSAVESKKSIAQMHMKATPHNVQLILDFKLKTILLTRNVYDSLASFARDIQKKKRTEHRSAGILGYSFVWLENCDKDWEFSDWLDYSIDYYLPWYLVFLSSWSSYRQVVNPISIRYEEIYRDPAESFSYILRELEIEKPLDESLLNKDYAAGKAIAGTKSSIGSGLEYLTKKQKSRVDALFKRNSDEWVLSHLDFDT